MSDYKLYLCYYNYVHVTILFIQGGNNVLHILASQTVPKKDADKEKLKRTLSTLIDKGADVNAQNDVSFCLPKLHFEKVFSQHMQSPLLIASSWGRLATVHYLVKNGADANIKDKVCMVINFVYSFK